MHKFETMDYSQHLADLLTQLYQLESLVRAEDKEAILRLVMEMDWHCVADEFESVLARHCYGIEYHARRIIHNLQRPYLLNHDCAQLTEHLEQLEGTLQASPSLHADTDGEVAAAWQRELERAEVRHQPIRSMPAIRTLDGLREAVAVKMALGRALHGCHGPFDGGARLSVDEALWEKVLGALREHHELPKGLVAEVIASMTWFQPRS